MHWAFAIPVYNGKTYIEAALKSLTTQKIKADIYIYDNSLDDQTRAAISGKIGGNVYYIKNESNIGYARNVNNCLTLCERGYEYIGILHHDDVHVGESIGQFQEAAKQFPGAGLIFSATTKIDESGKALKAEPIYSDRLFKAGKEAVRCAWNIDCSSAIYKREALQAMGYLSLNYPYTADLEHFARIGSAFDVLYIGKVLAATRLHRKNYRYETWEKEDFPGSFMNMLVAMEALAGVPRENALRSAATRNTGTICAVFARLVLRRKIAASLRVASLLRNVEFCPDAAQKAVIGVMQEIAPGSISLLRRMRRILRR